MSQRKDPEINHGQPPSGVPWQLPDELKPLEAQLSALSPRRDRLKRERLIYLAGQASAAEVRSADRSPWRHPAWAAAFATMTTVAAMLLTMPIFRSAATDSTSEVIVRMPMGEGAPNLRVEQGGLVVGDVYRSGFARQLTPSELVLAEKNVGATFSTPIELQRPTLTPTGWDQILEISKPASSGRPDSSNLPIEKGIQS